MLAHDFQPSQLACETGGGVRKAFLIGNLLLHQRFGFTMRLFDGLEVELFGAFGGVGKNNDFIISLNGHETASDGHQNLVAVLADRTDLAGVDWSD